MCGIVGFTGKKDLKKTDVLLSTISYRGRDERIIDHVSRVNLGMNRLSINDLTVNIFPFKYKKCTLIFNGEIYNYSNLKNKLIEKKIELKTSCDAEVILPLYEIYGMDFLKYVEGMFALAIVDENKKIVVLARDRMGEKPLYYSSCNEQFIFGSEMRVLMEYFGKSVNLDKKKIGEYLYNGFVSNGGTLVENINKMPAAHYMIYDLQKKSVELKKYWSPEIKKIDKNETELIKELEKEIEKSVNERLLADVPVGCFLSGGVDSSLITYFASKKIKNMPVFSVSFPGFKDHDEIEYAKEIAKKLGLKQEIIECDSKNVRDLIKNIGKLIDEPIADMAVIPTYLLARKARESVKVVLTGEGADELFGGYERYKREILKNRLRGLINFSILGNKYKYSTQKIWRENEINNLMSEKYSPENDDKIKNILDKNLMLGMQIKDMETYLADNLFMKVDKMTMQNNLEARAPFVSQRIVNMAMSLDNNFKIRNGKGKYLLKKVAEKYLSSGLVWREKHGFSLPMDEWFKHDLKDLVINSLMDSKKYKKIINWNIYKQVVDDHMAGIANNAEKIWSVMVLVSWLKENKIVSYTKE